jgi:hypothetical protein
MFHFLFLSVDGLFSSSTIELDESMKKRYFRISMRKLMLLVAVLGIILGGLAQLDRRRRHFRSLAAFHISQRLMDSGVGGGRRGTVVYFDRAGNRLTDQQLREDAWHLEMNRKYYRAAQRPWLRVAPDTPKPH